MMLEEKIYTELVKAYNNAYAPYSKFHVGAVVVLKNGQMISGSNVENASYGLCNCAERSALFAAYSQGFRKEDIEMLAVIGNTKMPISPCGACRQVINELMDKDAVVVLTNLKKDIKTYKVKDLLPYSFEGEDITNE